MGSCHVCLPMTVSSEAQEMQSWCHMSDLAWALLPPTASAAELLTRRSSPKSQWSWHREPLFFVVIIIHSLKQDAVPILRLRKKCLLAGNWFVVRTATIVFLSWAWSHQELPPVGIFSGFKLYGESLWQRDSGVFSAVFSDVR